MHSLYKIYAVIRQFLQPYWQPNPCKLENIKHTNKHVNERQSVISVTAPVSKRNTNADASVTVDPAVVTPVVSPVMKRPGKSFTVITRDTRLERIWESSVLPEPMQCWYYHDNTVHELFSHLLPGTGWRYTSKERSQQARKRLQPLLWPKQDKPWDRTHLIPFGYHGSEADPRLVIGWDSEQNRNGMRDFEQKQKNRSTPIYWLARVTRHTDGYGATLLYMTWDARDMRLLDSAEFTLSCPFFWRV